MAKSWHERKKESELRVRKKRKKENKKEWRRVDTKERKWIKG